MVSAKKILIVSRDLVLENRLKAYLSQVDYEIICTQKTDDRLKLYIDQFDPDIILVEPEISQVKIIELILRIRNWTPIPILALTTAKTTNKEIRVFDFTAADYFSEPFDIAIIAARINHILSPSPAG